MDGPGMASLAASSQAEPPSSETELWVLLSILVVALLFCALAAAAETAFNSISRIKLKSLIEEEDQQAVQIDRLLSEPNLFLSTILLFHGLAIIIATSMMMVLTERIFSTWSTLITIVSLSLGILIFCEVVPRTIVVQNPLRWARMLVGPVRGAAWLLRPLVWLLGRITTVLERLFGKELRHRGPFVTEEEFKLLVSSADDEEGGLEEDEKEMIKSIFEFADTTVRAVMIPRIDMVILPGDATVTDAADVALQGGFSRIPVYDASVGVDDIIGILYTKDLLGQMQQNHDYVPIKNIVRPPYFVPETKKLDDLLREIRQSRNHMVIVIDEYGSVAGLVTIEDLVEEIVGDIQDEYDHEEKLYEKVAENEYIVDAKISIYEFNELVGMRLDDSDYETLGGFVYAQLDKIPNTGDTITFENVTFTVLAKRGRRITKVLVERQRVLVAPEAEGKELEQKEILLLPAPGEENTSNRRNTEDLVNQEKTTSHYDAVS